jgi:hypothetical protein
MLYTTVAEGLGLDIHELISVCCFIPYKNIICDSLFVTNVQPLRKTFRKLTLTLHD